MAEIVKIGGSIINFDHVVSVEPQTERDGKKSCLMRLTDGQSLEFADGMVDRIEEYFRRKGEIGARQNISIEVPSQVAEPSPSFRS